jgi:hypothetical protein
LQGQKARRRRKAKCYRENEKLRVELASKEKSVEKYRKRSQRDREALRNLKGTPRSATRKLLGRWHRSASGLVRKTLVFHHALIADLQEKYRKSSVQTKRALCTTLSGRVLKKYRKIDTMRSALGCYSDQSAKKKSRRVLAVDRLMLACRSFFERDDNSRLTAGKKQTITRRKVKKQKRLLNDTLFNLHQKLLAEGCIKLSYSTFCRLRPFWVVHPSVEDRQTCLCKSHENMTFMVVKLHQLGIAPSRSLEHIACSTVCDAKSRKCMYGECSECSLNNPSEFQVSDDQDVVSYQQWRTSYRGYLSL